MATKPTIKVTNPTPVYAEQQELAATNAPKAVRAYLPIRIGEPVACPKKDDTDKPCYGTLSLHEKGKTELVCSACKTIYSHDEVEAIRYQSIKDLLERSEKHGLTPEEAICTPAMLYLLKRYGLTAICVPADQDPYKTDTYTRRPCLDAGCAKYGGSLITTDDGYKCNREGCHKTYTREQVLKPCPVCGELLLRRGVADVEGTEYCPAGDCVFVDDTESDK